jgi:hypothetical protein
MLFAASDRDDAVEPICGEEHLTARPVGDGRREEADVLAAFQVEPEGEQVTKSLRYSLRVRRRGTRD